MKEVTPPFRLYDFLAYLFPGIATLHGFYLYSTKTPAVFIDFLAPNAFFNFATLMVVSYAIGLFWSSISRDVIRKLCWLAYNPRLDFLFPRKFRSTPLDTEVRKKIRGELEEILPPVDLSAQTAYIVCRTYVAQNCPTSWARRESICNIRAMATNFIGPMLIYTIYFFSRGYIAIGWISITIVVILLRRTVTHDSIEWKEIYMTFLIHRILSKQTKPQKD